MSFEKVKETIKKAFKNGTVRYDRPDYLEIGIDASVMPNQQVKELYLQILKQNKLPEFKAYQISPSVDEGSVSVGATFVCDDENFSLCVATCIWIQDRSLRDLRRDRE